MACVRSLVADFFQCNAIYVPANCHLESGQRHSQYTTHSLDLLEVVERVVGRTPLLQDKFQLGLQFDTRHTVRHSTLLKKLGLE